MADYKSTLNLPKTSFPMKGNLPQTEPELLSCWEKGHLFEELLAAREMGPSFILHDGPPYANGDIHMGHALNKILKDIIVRYQILLGKKVPYVPGWDCHGLPIEYALMKEMKVTKHQVNVVDFRKEARKYARKYVSIQRDQFKRLGVTGDWGKPYLTLAPDYVATALRTLSALVSRGFVYQARKPVNWCWNCETALAEAEVEYQERQDQSVYVTFPFLGIFSRILKEGESMGHWLGIEDKPEMLVWTTTPWTLPANVALMIHPDYEYAVVRVMKNPSESASSSVIASPEGAKQSQDTQRDCFVPRQRRGPRNDVEASLAGRILILLSSRVNEVLENTLGLTSSDFEIIRRITGKELAKDSPRFQHPFLVTHTGPGLILNSSVSPDEGTGIVHIAPGHGEIDYIVGKANHLNVFSPVDSSGKFSAEVEPSELRGLTVLKEGNEHVVDLLKREKNLVGTERIDHPYPHCWRCHNPIIFRATDQWFLNIEHEGLRQKLLEAVEKNVQWIPPEGKERMRGMIKTRPDWCLSRQRLWGIPIPAVICSACGEGILDPLIIENFAKAIEGDPEGSDRWFTEPVEKWLPSGFACVQCKGHSFKPGTDILDVWFDSGVSHEAVLRRRKELSHPADLYLEGSDQHRGWFQVSLITGVALNGKPPYRGVLTHGFVVDGDGRKMSKSLGNVIAPQEVVSSLGADVLRLWVASSDYREDIRLSPVILSQVSEIYRKIRNTLRFCLANVSDFNLEGNHVPPEKMGELDRWILTQLRALIEEVTTSYEQYAFHKVVKALHEFCTVKLSNFYLDVIKDCLYTSLPDDPKRRSVQTALVEMAKVLCRLMAPILPMTAEEAWGALQGAGGQGKSIFFAPWPKVTDFPLDRLTEQVWDRLLQLRDQVMKRLEEARASGLIAEALEAHLELRVGDPDLGSLLNPRQELFQTACVVSSFELVKTSGSGVEIEVTKAPGDKCQRCWMRLPSVGKSPEHPALCHRCVEVLQRLQPR